MKQDSPAEDGMEDEGPSTSSTQQSAPYSIRAGNKQGDARYSDKDIAPDIDALIQKLRMKFVRIDRDKIVIRDIDRREQISEEDVQRRLTDVATLIVQGAKIPGASDRLMYALRRTDGVALLAHTEE